MVAKIKINETGDCILTEQDAIDLLYTNPEFDIAKLFDTIGIAIRSGHHCAQPLMKSLNSNYTNRVSLYAYNNLKEIDYFIDSLKKVLEILK